LIWSIDRLFEVYRAAASENTLWLPSGTKGGFRAGRVAQGRRHEDERRGCVQLPCVEMLCVSGVMMQCCEAPL